MRNALTLTLAIVIAAGAPAAALAQNKTVSKSQVTLTWDEFVKITGYDPTKAGGPQVLTITWAEMEKLLGIKVENVGNKATVDLPWQEFKSLLQWSVNRAKPGDDTPPPTDYIVTASEFGGTVSDETASLVRKLSIEILRKKGWTRIPVLPGTVAVTKRTLPAGVFLSSNKGNYELLTNKPGKLDVTLEFAAKVVKSAGTNRVSIQAMPPCSSVVDLTIGRKDVDVKVAQAQSLITKVVGEKTQVAAALPTGAQLDLSWERALPKVAKAPTKLYAETRTLVAVAEGVLLCQEMVQFNILHTAVRELKLTVPAGVSVLQVSGPNVQDWRVAANGELQVVLSREVLGSQLLRISYEKAGKDLAQVPLIRAAGVEREKGFAGVVALANVEISAGAVTGATVIDVRQLPSDIVSMTNQPILLAFRYVGDKVTIPLTVKKHDEVDVLVTIVDSGLFTAMQLNDGRRMTKVVYGVRNNRNQFLRLKMPEPAGWKLDVWSVSVSGKTVSPAKDEKGNLLIPLVRSAGGGKGLTSFPVEIVYVETPGQAPGGSGVMHVDLPVCGEPVIHLMYSYYLPAEGKYTVGWGGKRSGFSGPIRLVDDFTSLSAGPGVEVIRKSAAKQVKQMQQQMDTRVDAAARAAGATPIRVRLPIRGTQFKLEKILALPHDQLWFEVKYRDWQVAK